MSQDPTAQTVLFPHLANKPVVAELDQAHSSSDGGGVLLKGIDQRLGLTEALAECLCATRAQRGASVSHFEGSFPMK